MGGTSHNLAGAGIREETVSELALDAYQGVVGVEGGLKICCCSVRVGLRVSGEGAHEVGQD